MKKSLFLRLFASYLFIIVTLTGIMLMVVWSSAKDDYLSALNTSLRRVALALRPTVVALVQENASEELQKRVKTLGDDTKVRITVIDNQGVVLADSEEDARRMENHKGRPEVVEALHRNVGSAMRFSSTANEYMLYVAIPLVKADGELAGVLRTSLAVRSINSSLANLRQRLVRVALLTLLIAIVPAALLSKTFSKPIQELISAVKKVSSGDFRVRLYLRNPGELKELSDSFNTMSDQIETMVVKLRRRKEALDSIIGSLQEGLAVINRKGQITRSNESFKKIVRSNIVEGSTYWQVFRNAHFTELIEKARREKTNLIEELEIDEAVFLCSITHLEREELVVVFHDISEIRKVEQLKRDFVVNVSHELRTPLTAIKGFTETLFDEADPQSKQYLEIIKRNTDRLINIINDLLLLSELEEKGMKLEVDEIDLKSLVENTLKIFGQRAADKGLKISAKIDEKLQPISGDAFKLEQVIINLLDNAIKYTDTGEVGVLVFMKDQGSVSIEVWDTGIGIPNQDLSRIFERFYVVDKSRSKKVGGTGLGLSIVKHIVLLHNGTIEVKSAQGKGTTVRITMPVNLFKDEVQKERHGPDWRTEVEEAKPHHIGTGDRE